MQLTSGGREVQCTWGCSPGAGNVMGAIPQSKHGLATRYRSRGQATARVTPWIKGGQPRAFLVWGFPLLFLAGSSPHFLKPRREVCVTPLKSIPGRDHLATFCLHPDGPSWGPWPQRQGLDELTSRSPGKVRGQGAEAPRTSLGLTKPPFWRIMN